MKRWILLGTVICALLVVWSLDYRSQNQDAGTTPSPQQQYCHEIVVGTGTAWLLDRCEGNTWKYYGGYDTATGDFTNDPAWIAMAKQ